MLYRFIDLLIVALATVTLFTHRPRGNWQYRLGYWFKSRKPGFSMSEHNKREYPLFAPSLEGFTPATARRYVKLADDVAFFCSRDEAHELIKSQAPAGHKEEWPGERDARHQLLAEAQKFYRRWA